MSEKPRWRVGTKLGRTLYRNNHCVGMVDSPELAAEIVASLNGTAPNDRDGITAALSREANRIFNQQVQDYPSNVLDVVAWNLRAGENDFLSVRAHPSGNGIDRVVSAPGGASEAGVEGKVPKSESLPLHPPGAGK